MTRQELKTTARNNLGNSIFGNIWLFGVLICFIYSAIIGGASSLLPGIATLLLTGPLAYGLSYAFLRQSREKNNFYIEDLFNGFSSDFGQTFLLGLLITIFTALWTLLFLIPGIVKSYAYSMSYMIKVDNPDYDWRQCIDESIRIMDGHKMDLFVLDLSFIGWYLLGALAFGIGSLWVLPYHQAARAEFYKNISNQADNSYQADYTM